MWNKGIRFAAQRVFLSAMAIFCIIPMAFLVRDSLSLFGQFTLFQYEDILLYQKEFYRWFWNSVIYTVVILVIQIPVSVLAAYGFTQYEFPGKKVLFSLYILALLLPFQATVVSQYLTLDAMHLLNTRLAVILPNAYSTFGAFLIAQYMRGISPEILQAAQLEGANGRQIFFHVILPLCRPAIVSQAVLQMFSCWSLIDQPLLFLRSRELTNLAVELTSDRFAASAPAAGVVFAILPLLAYLYCKDALERGISLSNIQ